MSIFLQIARCSLPCLLLLQITQASPITKPGKSEPLSQDEARKWKSREMLKFMNNSADPCENFYEFACGNYEKYYRLDEKVLPVMSLLGALNLAMEEKFEHEFETEDSNATVTERNAKNFYKSCMNTPSTFDTYPQKLKEILKEFGQMPVLEADEWRGEEDFDWLQAIAGIKHKMHVSVILAVEIYADYSTKSSNRVNILSPTFNLKSKSIYEEELFKVDREKYMKGIANKMNKFLGVDMALALETAKELLEFEIALVAGIINEKSDYQVVAELEIDEMQEKYSPMMDSKKFFTNIYDTVPKQILVESDYLENVLSVVNQTTPRILANYIFFNFLDEFMFDPPENEDELQLHCMAATRFFFYKTIDNMIYRKYFTEEMKVGVTYMWKEMKATFAEVLKSNRLNWINDATRVEALEKLKSTKLQILSYEDLKHQKDFDDLDFSAYDYIDNKRKLLAKTAKQNVNKINQPPNLDIPDPGSSLSPTYSVTENAIQIPIAVLQPYFTWSLAFPNSFNYATLGFYVSHELIHAFDGYGSSYDLNGISRRWWDEESTKRFDNRSKCFVTQYQQYEWGGVPLPEMESQGENIADNGGVRLAYEAYRKWQEKATIVDLELELMPAFNYTNEQMFFISYGQVWCAATHPNHMAKQAASDLHVPEKFRVLVPLSNFKEFSKVFNCPLGSGMNPEAKCEIY